MNIVSHNPITLIRTILNSADSYTDIYYNGELIDSIEVREVDCVINHNFIVKFCDVEIKAQITVKGYTIIIEVWK